MISQGSKLAAAFALVVRAAEHPGRLAPILQELGQRHANYGVKAEDYDAVRGSLIQAFAETLGDQFTPTARLAWQSALLTVSAAMIAGGMTNLRRSA